MPKRKSATTPIQSSLASSSTPHEAEPSEPQRKSSDLFVVDNDDLVECKVAWYLSQWCDIARTLDIASGYFEIGALLDLDGQWQKLEQIRILMGDEVSKKTKQAFEAALGQIIGKLDASLEQEKEKNDFLTGVPAIVQALQSGRILCKVYRERKFHAKAYITRAKMDVVGPTALVGSSNFTHPGLYDNVELNVQLRVGVDELQAWYDKYWQLAEDVTPEILRTIERHARDYSPFEVYAKAMYEFFKGHSMTPSEWERTGSCMYPVLDEYQREGYHDLVNKSARYNGALLCDSVGLGKTFIGLMLIERLLFDGKRVALLVPKAARGPVWESKLNRYMPGLAGSRFGNNFVIYNHTDLLRGGDYPRWIQEVQERADAIIIDEAHHFRNQAAKTYRRLFEVAEGKLLFLLTATPINNSLLDLQHMIELFSRRQTNYFKDAPLGIHSLVGHFRALENALARLVGEKSIEVELSATEAERVLAKDDLFRELVVQRSRAYAKRSQKQHGGAQVAFPVRDSPQVGEYSLAKTYGVLLDHLDRAFRKDKPLLSLAIYNPLAYPVGSDEGIDPMLKGRQMQVVGLIRTQLLKRFESSVRAFEATCEDLFIKLLAFVEKHSQSPAEARRLERWKGQHADLLERVKAHHVEPDEELDEDIITPEMLELVEDLPRSEYRVGEILDETFLDLDQLAVFLNDLTGFSPKRDDKLQALIKLLTTNPLLKRHKVIIFSEYMATAHYVATELERAKIGPLDLVHSGIGRDRGEIIAAFSPYYNDSSSAELAAAGKTETRVLVSTDVLSEGLNLQDATLLINYDLHWNPVRVMQRIGRVDRRLDPQIEARMVVDHPTMKEVRGKVHFWNFLPPDELDSLLNLYERVAHKTLRISKIFGIEGRKLLRPEDDYEALKEFIQAYEDDLSPVEEMRLAFLELLQVHPGLEEKLVHFPRRVFSGREHPSAALRTSPSAGARAIFFCYTLPAKNVATGRWDDEAGFAQWYLYDLDTDKIETDAEHIYTIIQSRPDTPRHCEMPQETLADIRKKVEKHIKNTYLKSIVAPAGIRPVLRAWMELN